MVQRPEIYALLTCSSSWRTWSRDSRPHVAPLLERLKAAIGSADHSTEEVQKRIRILHLAKRAMPLKYFQMAARALLERKRLRITYYTRARDEGTRRDISLQRLIHYRENWYLDAWCHLRQDIRSFAVDAIRQAVMLDEEGSGGPRDRELDECCLGYGIFSGREVDWAKLRFTRSARAGSPLSSGTRSSARASGGWVIFAGAPYSDPRELVMDILRHGPAVEVLAPQDLRRAVREALSSALNLYPEKA